MEKGSSSGGPGGNGDSAEILLVEDDAVHASLMMRALKECGFANRAEHVADGAEALEYLASINLPGSRPGSIPKLILLDLGLPKISGMHVLRQLKSDARTKSIPIVILTSSKIAIELMESYKLGVNSYVIKPTEASKFAQLIGDISRYWLVINEPPV